MLSTGFIPLWLAAWLTAASNPMLKDRRTAECSVAHAILSVSWEVTCMALLQT